MADAVWLAAAIENVSGPSVPAGDPEPADDRPTDRPSPRPSNAPSGAAKSRGRTEQRESRSSRIDVSVFRKGPAEGLVEPVELVAVDRGPALSGARAIVRALRPLHRKMPSRLADNLVLDEVATAEHGVQDDLWLPRMTPAVERWLDLTLVVDASPSMSLWHSSVRAFGTLLEQLGTFRTIQHRRLDVAAGPDGGVVPVLRGGTPRAPARGTSALLDPGGRRVVLVMTDGVGAHWHDPAFTSVLARWGRSMPTAVIHLLPQRMWRQGGLPPHRAKLSPRGRLSPNRRWRMSLPDDWLEADELAPPGTVPVPMFELDARWLRRWAQLVVGDCDDAVDATVLLTHESPAAQFVDDDVPILTPHDQVKKFVATVSPPARRLATLLAAVQVSVPVARLIQSELVPEAGPETLTEVLAGGLFLPTTGGGARAAWDKVIFTIDPEVRKELLGGARRSETVRVVKMVSSRFGDHPGAFGYIAQALDAPDETPDPPISADNAELVEIQRIVLRALSGPYLPRADRLPTRPAPAHEPTTEPIAPTETEPVRDMADAPPRAGAVTDASPTAAASSAFDGSGVPAPLSTASGAVTLGPPVPQVTRTVSVFERPSQDIPAVWGNIPPRNPNFTGREELLQNLADSLALGGTTAVLPSALHGMGGIGKTQTAVEYIYRHVTDYDLVWWIQASQPSLVRNDLAELARALQLPGSGEINTAVPAVREALRRGQPMRRWLLVFDAADDVTKVREFFPVSGPGQILVTSRNPEWKGIASPLEVATFERAESIELLRRRGPEIDDADADRLAETLGDLPLAIEQAAAWRAETGMPVQEYLRLFEEKVAEIQPATAPTGYELSVAAAWNVSFDELGSRNAAAHQLLQVCAFFSPEPISRHLFVGVRGLSIAPDLDRALRDPMRLAHAIRDINRYGLAKIDHRNDTLQLHRLVQLVLRNRMTPQHQAEMRHGAHLLLANLDPNDPLSPSQQARYQEVLPHVGQAALSECDDAWGRQLLINLMAYLYRWGDHDGAVQLAEQVLQIWRTKLGPQDRQTLDVAGRLGYYYWIIGRYAEAAAINRETLSIRREVDGENAEETLSIQIAVAADLRAAGEFAAACDLTAEVLQKSKALFGTDDLASLRSARVHCISLRLVGRFGEAAELDAATHERLADILGQDHPDALSSLSGLILDRRDGGEYIWARDEQEKLASRAERIHGEDNADTLRRFAYLAVARRKAGDHKGALELSTRMLERFKLRYGLDSFNAMACALGRSIDLRHNGDLRDAKALGAEVVERYQRNMGEDHPYTVCAEVDYAVTLRLLGDVEEARTLDEQSLQKLRTRIGADHVHAIVCAINLASDNAALGNLPTALEQDTDALERAERVLGVDHPTTLAASLNLVLDMRALNRGDEVESRYADVLGRYRRVLGASHPATSAAAKGDRANCDVDPLPL